MTFQTTRNKLFTRNAVMNALLAQIAAATFVDVNGNPTTTAFVTTGRRLLDFSRVPPEQQPAAFLLKDREKREQQPPQGLVSKLYMRVKIVIYTSTNNENDVPAVIMDNCIDAIERALAPDDPSRNVFTLGGLVHWCWVEGDIMEAPGDQDGQGIAVVPIHILVP